MVGAQRPQRGAFLDGGRLGVGQRVDWWMLGELRGAGAPLRHRGYGGGVGNRMPAADTSGLHPPGGRRSSSPPRALAPRPR